MRKGLTVFFILAVLSPLSAENWFTLDHDWKTIKSENFTFVCPSRFTNLAEPVLARAEHIRSLLTPGFPSFAPGNTWILLTDNSDYIQDFATFSPQKMICLYLRKSESTGELNNFLDWNETLLLHEYTHILQMGQAEGLFRWLQIYPNQLMPIWMAEGIAVWDETHYTDFGRGRSSWVDMIYKADWVSDTMPGLDRLYVYSVGWPDGDIPYLYGYAFTDFLVTKYGEQQTKKISLVNTRSIPWTYYGIAKSVFKRSFPALYKEFQSFFKEKIRKDVSELSSSGITPAEVLVPGYGEKKFLTSYSHKLFYFSHDVDVTGRILEFDPVTGKKKVIVKDIDCAGFTFFNGACIFSRMRNAENGRTWFDLYSKDLASGRTKRLTDRARATMPFTDGSELYFLGKLENGRSCIMLKGQNTVLDSQVWTAPTGFDILEAVKVDDDFFLVMKQDCGYQDIFKVNPERQTTVRVTSNSALENGLYVDRDHGSLYFSSDPDHAYNIYSLELRTNRQSFKQLTRVITGAFWPCINDTELCYIGYESRGFDIRKSGNSIQSGMGIKYPVEPLPEPKKEYNPGEVKISHPLGYSFLPSFISSTYLSPYASDIISGSTGTSFHVGLGLVTSDIFSVIQAYFHIFTNPFRNRWPFEYDVDLAKFFNFFSIETYFTDHGDFYDFSDSPVRIRDLVLNLVFLRIWDAFSFHTGINYEYYQMSNPGLVGWHLINAGVYFSELYGSQKAVDHERGYSTSLAWVQSIGLSQKSAADMTMTFDFYIPLVPHLTFASFNSAEVSVYDLERDWNSSGAWGLLFDHELRLTFPGLWKESGLLKEWPYFFHYFGGDIFYEYMFDNSGLERKFPGPGNWVGIDLFIGQTMYYYAPVKFSVGVMMDLDRTGEYGIRLSMAPALVNEKGIGTERPGEYRRSSDSFVRWLQKKMEK